jgi:hypothetical protein
MGSIFSILIGGILGALYVYYAYGGSGDSGRDQTNAAESTACLIFLSYLSLILDYPLEEQKPGASGPFTAKGHTTDLKATSGASFFSEARNVDASSAIFSIVGGDQHISFANIDPGTHKSASSSSYSVSLTGQ